MQTDPLLLRGKSSAHDERLEKVDEVSLSTIFQPFSLSAFLIQHLSGFQEASEREPLLSLSLESQAPLSTRLTPLIKESNQESCRRMDLSGVLTVRLSELPGHPLHRKNQSLLCSSTHKRHYFFRDFRKKSSNSAEELSISTMKLSTLLVK